MKQTRRCPSLIASFLLWLLLPWYYGNFIQSAEENTITNHSPYETIWPAQCRFLSLIPSPHYMFILLSKTLFSPNAPYFYYIYLWILKKILTQHYGRHLVATMNFRANNKRGKTKMMYVACVVKGSEHNIWRWWLKCVKKKRKGLTLIGFIYVLKSWGGGILVFLLVRVPFLPPHKSDYYYSVFINENKERA